MNFPKIALLFLCCLSDVTNSKVFNMLVAKQGEGAYRRIQSAIDRIPDKSTTRFLVYIKNGIYNEKVHLPATKTNVSFIGESADGVIITWDDYAGKDGISAAGSYTFLAEGNDFYAENITIRNSAGDVGQAIAVRTTGERQVFKNCRFLGFQDTYYANKNRQYNLNCYIEGAATDFIYGDATAVFDSCTIHCVQGGQYITAPADTKLISVLDDGSTFYHGLLMTRCMITADANVSAGSYYLGRPWQPNASSVFISCKLGNHIKEEGWDVWGDTDNHLSGFFAEFQSVDLQGNPVDTLSRVEWSEQLRYEEVKRYYNLNYFLRKDCVIWDPTAVTKSLESPSGLTGLNYSLTWQEVNDAVGYVIIRNDSTIGFSGMNSYDDETANPSELNTYMIKSVSENGTLSDPSEEVFFSVSSSDEVKSDNSPIGFIISDKQIYTSIPVKIEVFSLSGSLIMTADQHTNLSLYHLSCGIYLVKIRELSGSVLIKKIIL